jgi:hypothetical protein
MANADFCDCIIVNFRTGDGMRSRSHTPDSLSSPSEAGLGGGNVGSPTIHQKLRAIGGVPTPFAASASPITQRSNPPTPTQSGRPDFIGLAQHGAGGGMPSYARPQHQPNYYDSYNVPNGEQRRILSEGELLYDRQYHSAVTNATRDSSGPIRELASSPQRGVYMWKDNSPTASGGSYFHSNPTSPIQHNMMNNGNGANRMYCHPNAVVSHQSHVSYNPNSHNYGVPKGVGGMGGPSISPPSMKKMYGMSVQPTNISSNVSEQGVRPSPISRRPMSFVRALEMTDSLEMSGRGANSSPAGTPKGPGQMHVNDLSDRSSVYDTNYEISV